MSGGDFLLELHSEEIPARMQRQAAADLKRLFAAGLEGAGLKAESIETFVTPRRLALIARGLPAETEATSEERRGPRADAPAQAIEGFLRSTGLSRAELEERDDPKGRFLYAVIQTPGRKTSDVLAETVKTAVRDFPWPKSMRWGAASISTESLRWVRPLHGVLALFGGEVVPIEVDGVRAGRTTRGHRFLSAGEIEIAGADDYAARLREANVILSSEERARIIAEGARKAARDGGFTLIEDEALAIENAGLTEWPVPLLGRFDPAFLGVPPEVVQLAMKTHQKYFAVRGEDGSLAPAFVCVANIEATDGGKAIVEGNEKVLAARLADARFFWDQDRKTPLAKHAEKLKDIVFHEKLGTVADKVERVASLARWLVEEGIVKGADPALAEQAARLSKADLVTGMVGEFPELQGIMGGHYARAEGLPAEVADAIRDHYKPVGQGDEVPTAPVTVAVSLADKLDSIEGFFDPHVDERPTGSKDPFALRRSALGIIATVVANRLRLPMLKAVSHHHLAVSDAIKKTDLTAKRRASQGDVLQASGHLGENPAIGLPKEIIAFFADRLKVQQREAGVRHDLIDAVFALGGEDDLVRLLARVKALQSFIETEEGHALLGGYKRAANILRIEEKKDGRAYDGKVDFGLLRLPEELGLFQTLEKIVPEATAAVEAEDFEGAMARLAELRPFVDAFFGHVTVNDGVGEVRENRLNLLNRIREAAHTVADFSKIEG